MLSHESFQGAFVFDQGGEYIGRVGGYGNIWDENDEQKYRMNSEGEIFVIATGRYVGTMDRDRYVYDGDLIVGSWEK